MTSSQAHRKRSIIKVTPHFFYFFNANKRLELDYDRDDHALLLVF